MDLFIELIKYLLPLIILLTAVLLILNHFNKREIVKLKYDLIKSNNKIITPIKLQAFERLLLFLERIKPDALAIRIKQSNMNALQTQITMLDTLRQEFNHNLTQQIYISEKSWSAVVNTKEQITRLINLTGSKMNRESSFQDFASFFIKMYDEFENKPVENTIQILKKEAAETFGI
jgi:hypothetical protein